MSELKNKINFTVACVDEFAQKNNLSVKEAFQYLFQFKGIEFIKENYEVEIEISNWEYRIKRHKEYLQEMGELHKKLEEFDKSGRRKRSV